MVISQVDTPQAFWIGTGQVLQITPGRLLILMATEKQGTFSLRKDGLRPGDRQMSRDTPVCAPVGV
jgi:hypothetical protein